MATPKELYLHKEDRIRTSREGREEDRMHNRTVTNDTKKPDYKSAG